MVLTLIFGITAILMVSLHGHHLSC